MLKKEAYVHAQKSKVLLVSESMRDNFYFYFKLTMIVTSTSPVEV